ncbi:hypothetical protein FKQ52_05025 [Brevundimonas sp. M20]|nr:hypothetical protein FKQ52_05025 [Brevundimonas sp. M20]
MAHDTPKLVGMITDRTRHRMKTTLLTLLVAGLIGVGGDGRAQAAVETVNGAGPPPFRSPAMIALGNAACAGESDAIRRSLADGAAVDGEGEAGITPLLWALRCRSIEGVRALLDAGADPDMVINGIPTVIFATRLENVEFLSAFLEHGANPNTSYDATWSSLLDVALLHGINGRGWDHWDLLLRSGVDVNLPTQSRQTTAMKAVRATHYDRAIELLERGYHYDLPELRRIATSTIAIARSRGDPTTRLRLVALLDERISHPLDSPGP